MSIIPGKHKKRSGGRKKGGRNGVIALYTSGTVRETELSPERQKEYIEEKIEVLKDFCITLTVEEERELRALTDPLSIDLWVRRLIAKRWGD